jgi:hypothetical protein
MYAILARTLAIRRDNLRGTVAALERRIATIKAPLFEPVAAYLLVCETGETTNRVAARAPLGGGPCGPKHMHR